MDIMIDIETAGTLKNSAIMAIAAVKFDIATGEVFEDFYVNVDLQSCIDSGMEVDGGAIYFWMGERDKVKQPARDVLFEDRKQLSEALVLLNGFVSPHPNANIWQHSNFDAPILEDAYTRNKTNYPWKFYNTRDIRTLMGLCPYQISQTCKAIPTNENAHDALADCLYQIKYCTLAYNYVKEGFISDDLIRSIEPEYFVQQNGEELEVEV